MPVLLRFLLIVAILAGGAYGAMLALATFYEPEQREITTIVPLPRTQK